MSAGAVSDMTFGREVLSSSLPVLVDFCAERGRPCQAMAPALDEIAKELEGKVKIVKVDVDKNPVVRNDYEIHGLPTLILFKNGKPAARRIGALARKDKLEEWINAALVLAFARAATEPRASSFYLDNGMQVVVIPDHRTPVVTHMVWYKVGAADEPKGAGGIAHLIEHLMFKSMDTVGAEEFSKTVSRLGGRYGLLRGRDFTAYCERISKSQLKAAMKLEAGRMVHLRLTAEKMDAERQRIIEASGYAIENNPILRLNEQMNAALFGAHPYGTPPSECVRRLARVTRKDVMQFYRRHYSPAKAVLVVSGDVTSSEVLQLAQQTYGKITSSAGAEARSRPQLPRRNAARRLTVQDSRAGAAVFRRQYVVPSYVTAKPGEAEALELLVRILGAGSPSRLYRALVTESKLVESVSCQYASAAVDAGIITLQAVATTDDLGAVEAGVDAALDDVRRNGVRQLELGRCKKALLANYIHDIDNQESIARHYGLSVVIGRTVKQIENWPTAISSVTADDIQRVANDYLGAEMGHSATGWLVPRLGENQIAEDAAL